MLKKNAGKKVAGDDLEERMGGNCLGHKQFSNSGLMSGDYFLPTGMIIPVSAYLAGNIKPT